MNKGKYATVIDVRTPGEFAEGHYPGAINIPLGEMKSRIDEVKALPKPIAAYCRSGNRSSMAVAMLRQNGINEVTNTGGLEDMLRSLK